MSEETKPPFELKFGQDAITGLRNATLLINKGFPQQYCGEYLFKEWNYGEKLQVELDAENINTIRQKELQNKLANNPNDENLKDHLAKQNIPTLILLQTITTIRKSPTKLETIEDFEAIPGRLGTLLANIAGFLNMSPTEEKKS